MQEDSKKYAPDAPTTELSATDRDASIARITAELLQACDPVPTAVKQETVAVAARAQPKAARPAKVAAPVAAQAQPKAAPAQKSAVLEKEISSATPDKSVEISQAIAKNLLESDEGVRPFRQEDEKFKDFFTTSAAILPKEMQEGTAPQERRSAPAPENPSAFARLRGLFARKPLLEGDDEDDDIFFPEEVALERAFPHRSAPAPKAQQAPIDETVQFDLALTQADAPPAPKPTVPNGDAPKGKVRFVQPAPVEVPLEPVIKTPAPAPVQVVQPTVPEIVLTPLTDVPVAPSVPSPAAEKLPPAEIAFEDLSAETAFLREECEVQTARKETAFTLAMAKMQVWQEALQTKYEAVKEQHAAAKAARQAAEEAEIEAEVDEMMLEMNPDEAGAGDTDESMLVLPQEEQDAFFADTPATQSADTFFADTTEETPADSFFADTIAADITGQAVPAPDAAMADPLLASVHTAFVARGGQAPVSEVSLLADFDTPLPETESAEVVPQEVVPAEIAQVAQEVADAALPQPSAQDARVDAPEPALPSGVCLFDQAADEAAAEAQLGEITFVGADAPAARETDPFVQDVRAQEDITLDWMPDVSATPDVTPAAHVAAVASAAAASVAVTPAPETMPLLGDTLLADIAEGAEASAQDAPSPTPFEDSPSAQRIHEPLPEDPEGIQFGLTGMRVKLLIRTFTTAIFATGLFLLGLMGQGVLPAVAAIDPASAPVPFLLVNLLLLLAAAGVSYPVFIEGITGLWRKPSPDTLPALATLAALLQLLLCLTLVDTYDAPSITLFSALAGISLFADALGSLVMAQVMQANFSLANAGVPHYLAYRVQGKDTQRTLTRGVEVDSPALLVSRPVQQMEGFLEKSFSPRASDRRAQWVAYGLLGGAVLAYLIAMLKGGGALGAASCFAAVLCIGAPFSVTLLAALPSVFLQRSAAKVGAVVPGWQSIASLGDINLLAVEASDLFPPLCAQLHGIKTFQKERVDLAILYATSMLMQGGDTLQNLFVGMIDNKPELLFPVKDPQHRKGLGMIGWCENYRVILGTRALMQAEGVPLPALDYENRYSKDGKRQILYLSVSGQLYAMFIISYRGEKNIARALRTLRKAHIRLLVNCTDPTLTARRIEEIYRLPAGFVTLLSTEQSTVMQGATAYRPRAEGCLLHLGSFASLVGGLRAASGAAGAERAASAIQLVWAGFSILLCLFLCITGGLMEVALIAILLYQLAWSVLNLGVVFTKKFE